MNNRKNLISALVYQVAHIIYGLILPRIVIETFGSDVNGLVASITQFLSFISLLEGGLGAVVLAELYRPIEKNDNETIKSILVACQRFFVRLAGAFFAYTIIVAIVYSISVKGTYSIPYTFSLVFILALTILAEYLFAVTNRLYLQATQRVFIVNYLSSITLIINIVIAFVTIRLCPEIHILKLLSSIAFFVQPLIYQRIICDEYKYLRKKQVTPIVLKNRWSGFAQNLAHFINMNTDVVLITMFSTLGNVSVYSVYMLAVSALRSIIANVANSFQSALGKYIAEDNIDKLKPQFVFFNKCVWGISLVFFSTCLLLVNPFVLLYTKGINDANYYQPLFGLVVVLANLIYCLREPYRLLILAGGKFKETNFGAIMEAALNIIISLLLIMKFGLLGVAIGTLVAIFYRMIYFIVFLRKDILAVPLTQYLGLSIKAVSIIVFNVGVYFIINITVDSVMAFCIYGMGIVVIEAIIVLVLFFGFKDSKKVIQTILRKI